MCKCMHIWTDTSCMYVICLSCISFLLLCVLCMNSSMCVMNACTHMCVCAFPACLSCVFVCTYVCLFSCCQRYFSFQPVHYNWCNKGCGMCYPVCGMVHIKEPLLLIEKSSPCGGSGFPFSLLEWSLTICLTPYITVKIKCVECVIK